MAQFIDVYQPKLPVRNVKTADDELILSVVWALNVKNDAWRVVRQHYDSLWSVHHHWKAVRSLLEPRNKLLPYFLAADQARCCICRMEYSGCDRKTAIRVISSMMRKVGAKSNDERLEGIIELIEGDATAIATGLWHPLYATLPTLKIACDELVANHKLGHLLTPAEFAEAHRKARYAVMSAKNELERLTDFIRECDGVLLEFAPHLWCQPYLSQQYQATRERMLELHIINAETDTFYDAVERTKRVWAVKDQRSDLPELPKSQEKYRNAVTGQPPNLCYAWFLKW